jgi:primosomal protein N' (replication factor Y)
VLIQTMNVKHPVIQFVQQHDFSAFFQFEIQSRKEFLYPPFSRLVNLTLKHKDNDTVKEASNKLAESLRADFKDHVVGPAAPIIGRMRNQYLMEIMIKLPKDGAVKYKKVIQHHINLLLVEKKNI